MIELLTDNPMLKYLLLVALFAVVTAGAYFSTLAVNARQVARRRLADTGFVNENEVTTSTLRSDQVQSAWLKLVNRIEKAGVSLVDTKDEAIRRRLIAAGYTAPYAPRVYTLLRLVMHRFQAGIDDAFGIRAAEQALADVGDAANQEADQQRDDDGAQRQGFVQAAFHMSSSTVTSPRF